MENFVDCCGFSVPAWVVDFLEKGDFSVRAACCVCRLYCRLRCATLGELVFYLHEVAAGRLPLRNCGKRTTAEITEKLGISS